MAYRICDVKFFAEVGIDLKKEANPSMSDSS